MNDHTTALVPLETWAYQSPTLRREGHVLDMGLFAESLIYYDRVIVVPATEALVGYVQGTTLPPIDPNTHSTPLSTRPPFLDFIDWFVQREVFDDLIALLNDGTVQIYHYAFHTVTMRGKDGAFTAWNAEDTEQQAGPTFERRILGHPAVGNILKRARHREKLYKAVRKQLVEIHSPDFTRAVENARVDFVSGERAAVAAQALVDDVYPLMGLDRAPEVLVTTSGTSERMNLTWNIDFRVIDRALGPFVEVSVPVVLGGLAQSNRILWTAALASSDLYLPTPMSRLVSTKLLDARERQTRPQQTMNELKAEVEFPDIRLLVNSGALSLGDVLKIRKKAKKFREWLQTQAERDRHAIHAYHNEVAKESGLLRSTRKAVRMFGAVGGAAVGAAVGAYMAGPSATTSGASLGAAAGAAIEKGSEFLFDVAGKLDEDWKPVVFGDWARDYVERAQIGSRPRRS